MDWQQVGDWIKGNAGSGAALIGSLLTGNIPSAVAAGISMVSSATGTDDPLQSLQAMQSDPTIVARLKELAYQNDSSIREHLRALKQMELEDQQSQQHETQETVRAGDKAEDRFVRWTRPGQSWLSLSCAMAYVFLTGEPDNTVLGLMLTLPWSYAGLRQIGKGFDSIAMKKK